jgi:NitT/TauT family transport system substrate-binding protein
LCTLLGAAALGLAAAFGAAAPARATDVTIGETVWVGYGPMFLARDLGYFKDAGLNVNLQIVDQNALAMAAEAAGRMDGSASTIDEILKYRTKDFCFKAVMVLDDSYGGDGAVAVADVKTLDDVRGKTVAMDEGSTSRFWWSYVLKKHNIPLDSFTLANMSADDAAAAFIAGRVPVAVTWEPNLTMVRTKKVGHVLMDSTSIPGVIVDVLQLSCKFIQAHPADVQTLVNGILKAVDYAHQHPDEANKIMAKGVGGYLSKPEDFADAEKGVRFWTKAMTVPYFGTMEKPGAISDLISTGNEIWKELGRMKTDVPYADIVDPTYIPKAP